MGPYFDSLLRGGKVYIAKMKLIIPLLTVAILFCLCSAEFEEREDNFEEREDNFEEREDNFEEREENFEEREDNFEEREDTYQERRADAGKCKKACGEGEECKERNHKGGKVWKCVTVDKA